MNLSEFIWKYNNQSIDVDWVYWSQCVDLIKKYTIDVFWITLWTFWWSAKSGWNNKSNTFPEDEWEKIENNYDDEDQTPKAWDIIFWWYGTYGHVWIVINWFKGENKIEVFNQNTGNWNWTWYDDRSRIENNTYNQCLGWYRLKDDNFEMNDLINENESLKEKNKTLNEENSELKEKIKDAINILS